MKVHIEKSDEFQAVFLAGRKVTIYNFLCKEFSAVYAETYMIIL